MTSKRICKLIMVTDPNSDIATAISGNNKYYNMEDNGDGTFTARYGRVGGHESKHVYSINKWDSKIRTQLRKGYTDVTPQSTLKNITFTGVHPEVLSMLNMLQKCANQHIYQTYIGTAADITYEQVQEALNYLTIASNIYQDDSEKANKNLIKVYSLIPRQMGNVGDYLIKGSSERDLELIKGEMDNLSTLSQQVKMQTGDVEEINILEQMGLEIEPISKLPISDHPRFSAAFRVVNKNTQTPYENTQLDNEHLLWHGTKRNVGISVMQNGLDIRFASYGIFGKGIYHSDNWHKAKQYSHGFYFLQNVKMGNKVYNAPRYNSGRLDLSAVQQKGYDSVLGKTDYNEYIVYRNNQTTIGYFLIVD